MKPIIFLLDASNFWRRAFQATVSYSDEGELVRFEAGETIVLEKGERHRLIGLEGWGAVAEFWQHTDPKYPSDEEDIVRVQDDYARK